MIWDSSSLLSKAYNNHRASIRDACGTLANEFRSLKGAEEFLLSRVATTFILNWMRDYYRFQKELDGLFGRNVSPQAADQFTAAVGIALEKYLSTYDFERCVKSEISLAPKKRGMRPDISIWAGQNNLVGFIECKTQLGWNRSGWQSQYHERTNKARSNFSDCLSYLCVLTNLNWKTTWPDFHTSELAGTRWFCLLDDVWPSDFAGDGAVGVPHPIEPMFIEIKNTLRSLPQFRLV